MKKEEFVKFILRRVSLMLIIHSYGTLWFYIGKYNLNQLWGGLGLILIVIPLVIIINWIRLEE